MSREWVTMRFCPSIYTCRLERQLQKNMSWEYSGSGDHVERWDGHKKQPLLMLLVCKYTYLHFALVPSITIFVSASHQLLRLRSLRSDGILRKVSWIQMATGWVLSGTPFPPADWTQEHSKPDPSSNYLRDVIELEVNVGEAKSGESSIAVNVKLN